MSKATRQRFTRTHRRRAQALLRYGRKAARRHAHITRKRKRAKRCGL